MCLLRAATNNRKGGGGDVFEKSSTWHLRGHHKTPSIDKSSRRNDCGCGNGCGFDVCPSITIGSENNTVVIMNVRVGNIV